MLPQMFVTFMSTQAFLATVSAIILAICGTFFYSAIYKLYFHSLARFPGPRTAAISNLPYCHWFLSGKQPYHLLRLHQKYGHVVRTAPNELSFDTTQSWKDIYDFRPGHKPFLKSKFYENGTFADQTGSIVAERDPKEHSRMRKYLSHGFSQRSLSEQEFLISEVVDRFVEQMGQKGAGEEGIDIGSWFVMMTFDIIGSLAFGETFGGVDSGKTHPWIRRALEALTKGALVECFKRFPYLAKVFIALAPGVLQKAIDDTKLNEQTAIELVKKRVRSPTDRKDFFTNILAHKDYHGVRDVELAAQASDFALAGSETTATALSSIIFYLTQTPGVYDELCGEIRSQFSSFEHIKARSVSSLKYLHAVCLEGLRIYPPVPFALPRLVPEGGDTVDKFFLPGGTVVSTSPVAASLNASNFHYPFSFVPARWLDNGDSGDILEASQPFSVGPRGCIGRSLAWMELKTTLAKLLYTYDVKRLDENLDWHRDSRMNTLWNKPNLKVQVKARCDRTETIA